MERRGFSWICTCGSKNEYNGKREKDAITTCSRCGTKLRIWRLRILDDIDEEEYEKFPQNEYIYFIKSENFVKIGYTLNIETRLQNLQGSNPHKLKLIYSIETDHALEILLHKYYQKNNKHHRNEWFIYDVFTERVINVLKIYEKQLNKAKKLKNRIMKGLNDVEN